MEQLSLPFFIAMVAKILVAFVFVLLTVAYATWAERKIIGHMQVRIGPNRVGWFGLLQPIADGLKLFFKEEIIPDRASKFAFLVAPLIAPLPLSPSVTWLKLPATRFPSRLPPSLIR
jgi:NADH-quinone oxidoreductase subunit H